MRKGFIILLLIGMVSLYGARVYAQVGFEDDSVQIEFEDEVEVEPTAAPKRTPTPTRIPARDYIVYGEEKKQFDEKGVAVITTPPSLDAPSYLETGLSAVKISFDELRPNMMQEKGVSMAIGSAGKYSYQVVGIQSSVLSNAGRLIVDNTLCDVAKTPCTTTFARRWQNNEAAGFGYRLTGKDSPLDFLNDQYYRVLPLATDKNGNATSDSPIVLFNNQNVEGQRDGQLFFKIVPPPTFEESTYTTELKIITYPAP